MKTSIVVLTVVWALKLSGLAASAPPFDSSIKWNTGKESPSLEAMRGKAVLVVFFQSWCPKCNVWSGEMFQNFSDTFKDDPRVVLVALKTDGGSMEDALKYLESRVDTAHWLVGMDENATYARQATGMDSLYTYAWITPEGGIGESGKAGTSVSGSSPKQYWAARDEARRNYVQPAKTLLAADTTVPETLQPVLRLAEQGLHATALRELQPLSGNAELQEMAGTLRTAIAGAVQASVERHGAALTSDENPDRYWSYLALLEIEERFPGSAFAQAAKQATSAQSRAPWLEREKSAQKAYEGLMRKAARAADDDRAAMRVTKSLKEFGAAHSDTVFGRLAAKAEDAKEE